MDKLEIGIKQDDFGRFNGVLLVNKPKGITSHDVVYKVRKILNTRKVGHSGALDPYASGLVIILVGKHTKLSNTFLDLDKEYIAKVLLGVTTDSFDVEGKVLKTSNEIVTKEEVITVLKKFQPSYIQFVPVFSSVKVAGQKLRVVARKYDTFELSEGGRVHFYRKGEDLKEITLPSKEVKLYSMNLLSYYNAKKEDLALVKETIDLNNKFIAEIRVSCSKGTYIRQLAYDIGDAIKKPSMLVDLSRTKIGPFSLVDSIDFDNLENVLQN